MSALDTIVSVAEKIYKVYEALKTIHEAPEVIKSLQIEVARIRGLLARIIETIGDDEDMKGKYEDVFKLQPNLIEQARLLTEAANKFLEKTTKRKEDGTLEVKSGSWLLNVSDAKDLATKFAAFHGAVSAIYAVNTLASITLAGPSIIRAMDERMAYTVRHEIAGVNETVRQTIREEWVHLFEEHQETMARTMVRTMMSVARDQQEGRSQLFDELSILRDNWRATHGSSLNSGFPPVTQDTDLTHSLIRRSSTSSLDGDRQSIITSTTCDSLDTVSPRPRPADFSSSGDIPQLYCPQECLCRCHQPSGQCQLMSSALTPGLGMHVPGALVPPLASLTVSCDDTGCVRNRGRLLNMRRLFPTWFARVEGTIRSRSCPVHFKIQTRRIVKSLSFLYSISLDEFRMKLTNREITVNDTRRDGFTLLHALVVNASTYKHEDLSVVYEMIHLAVELGARYDWEYVGYTMTEFMLHKVASQDALRTSSILESFNHNIARPLLREDVKEVWDNMRAKHNWSDLHCLLANPLSSPAQVKHDLAAILVSPPSLALCLNTKDRFGRAPLRNAIYCCPEAVDALLRAGANPRLTQLSPLGYAANARAWSVVGPLVRAGANVNQRGRWSRGELTTPLHDVTRLRRPYARPGLLTALELVRHGGHLLDWDIEDDHGSTPLDWAEARMKGCPDDGDAPPLYKLYKTRKLPPGTHLIDRSRLEHAARAVDFESMSLIQAGLKGNINAIGALISAGAMVNERDEAGRTLLHLIAMGMVQNGYAVAIEIVRYGGYGVDWHALTANGQTAEDLAEQSLKHLSSRLSRMKTDLSSFTKDKLRGISLARLQRPSSLRYKINREEAVEILRLLQHRTLPQGIDYIYPCMHPNYCRKCSSLPCTQSCS